MEWVRRETIGRGSFSAVSLASPVRSSAAFPPLMAVKSAGEVCSAALRNEKQVLDHLGDDCPQIIRCFGDGWTVENGERIYNLFLEYASGGSLADPKKGAALAESEVRRFTRSIVKGLLHIHAKGFSHCDIKLENILVSGDGDVKISDFGLAKKMNILEETRESKVEIRGTPLYMAPESVNDSVFESPADIWALGCSVVEMASGKTAWSLDERTANVMSLLVRIGLGDELPRIPTELSDEGKDFLGKCFVKNPRERWTAQMLLDHPFLAVDEQSSTGQTSCHEEQASVSPRCPFDFPDWVSVQSPVSDSSPVYSSVKYSPFDSLEERIVGMVTDEAPDWSVLPDWVTVR